MPPLGIDFSLVKAARVHSRAMLRRDVFAHGDFAARIRAEGVTASYAAENIAWGTGSLGSARAIVAAWLASPPHRANLLHPRFRRIGIGAPTGWFAGYRDATVATADFVG